MRRSARAAARAAGRGGVVTTVAGGSTKDVRLSLVAYSTPREAYNQLIEEFQKTQPGNGVSFSQSYAASGDQTPRRQGRPEGGRRRPLARARRGRARRRPASSTRTGKRSLRRHGHELARRLRRPRRQPEEDQGLERPDPAGRPGGDAEPVHLGRQRQWNVMAAYGAQRKLGKTDKQAQDYLLKLFKNVVSQDKSARDSLQTFNVGQGRRSARVRERGALRAVEGAEAAVRDPAPDDPDREPDRGPEDERAQGRRRTRFSASCARPTAQRIFAENGYRPVNKAVAREFTKKFPRRPGSSRSTTSGSAAGTGPEAVLRPADGIMARIERQVGGVTG